MHDDESVQSSPEVIDYDSSAFRQTLQLTNRRRLQNVEDTKKYKAGEKGFPSEGDGNQRDQLTGDFVNHDELRIFQAGSQYHARSGGDSDQRYRKGGCNRRPGTSLQRDTPACQRPQNNG